MPMLENSIFKFNDTFGFIIFRVQLGYETIKTNLIPTRPKTAISLFIF